LARVGQLSSESRTPSTSASGHPRAVPSTVGQASKASGHASVSVFGPLPGHPSAAYGAYSFGHWSSAPVLRSVSGSGPGAVAVQSSPTPSLSVSSWPGFDIPGQLSVMSATSSLSASANCSASLTFTRPLLTDLPVSSGSPGSDSSTSAVLTSLGVSDGRR